MVYQRQDGKYWSEDKGVFSELDDGEIVTDMSPGIQVGSVIYKRSNGFYQVTNSSGKPFGVGLDKPGYYTEAEEYAEANPNLVETHPDELPAAINAQADRRRQAAYAAESDPLFFRYQRGDATEAEWLAKIAEIKARFPKVEE